ncbi:MAG TPA: class I SAM-dependent methyltransferase [Frankiaceae bacterium]|nr:class I SAM-dependent methyltransferase [Frankiaceae bacterium]
MDTSDSSHDHHHATGDYESEFGQAAWEARYNAVEGGIWSGNPNLVLVTETARLEPGSALDVGCGEGADALWLAERGWQVTGTDISTVALERAAKQGQLRGLDVAWQHVDLLADPPKPGSYDLVSAHFMQLPPDKRRALYARLGDAVVAGGTLLIVGHHPEDMLAVMGRTHLLDMMFTAEELAAELDPKTWEVLLVDARPREATHPEGHQVTIRDTVLVARKRSG